MVLGTDKSHSIVGLGKLRPVKQNALGIFVVFVSFIFSSGGHFVQQSRKV